MADQSLPVNHSQKKVHLTKLRHNAPELGFAPDAKASLERARVLLSASETVPTDGSADGADDAGLYSARGARSAGAAEVLSSWWTAGVRAGAAAAGASEPKRLIDDAPPGA